MRTKNESEAVLALIELGWTDAAIALRTGIPRRTVSDWRAGRAPHRKTNTCPICRSDHAALPGSAYAYALGLYLGDGCISPSGRTYRLRFALDAAYPGIVAECCDAVEALAPGKRAWARQRPRSACVDVSVYWNHWPCLFPQHGAGRKHERRIVLTGWQRLLIEGEDHALLRGLIHSDGCRVVANDRGVRSIRYHFCNESEDIKAILCEALDRLSIPWTRPCGKQIAVYRRAATEVLDGFVGPKH
jgi:hypothetical protein